MCFEQVLQSRLFEMDEELYKSMENAKEALRVSTELEV